MDIVELFQNHFGKENSSDHDFTLIEYSSNILVGMDSFRRVCVVVKSSGPCRFPIKHKTQKMSIECNMKVCYELNGKMHDDIVHIIRCLSELPREKNLFLELATVLIHESGESEEAIIEASNPVPTPLLGHRCRSSQEITGSPTPFSTSNHYLWICASASFSLSNPNIAA